ncbi:uncharacterized protein [Parasteatoda tepidariorum]|nr:uncharacterized protein LOC107452082 [Parasteatoda tepidariorum]XP_015923874.2 uncharacterized protein LOC107452082 [Parasteatoda tepidariorum]
MSSFVSQDDKKTKTSFWGKLFKTSKKSEKKSDESFLRQSFLHSSFHCSKPTPLEQDDGVNFTTLDNSDLMEMHKDAGIIFVNKNHVSQMLAKEDGKHVQFVPTPMNKYYKVNTKAAPSKKNKKDEDKENIDRTKNIKPARPILRVGKSQENLAQKLVFSDSQAISETNAKRLVNVSYYDGPEIKRTPTMQRTSTKLALFDRKNGSMPHLNVSGITKYGTLPKNAKFNREVYNGELIHTGVSSQMFGDGGSQTYVAKPRSCEQLNIPGEYSSRNLPHFSDQILNIHQMRDRSRQIVSHRLSLGEPIISSNSQQFPKSSVPSSGLSWQNQLNTRNISNSSKTNEIRSNLNFTSIQNQSQGYFPNNKKTKFSNRVLAENVNRKIDLYPNKAINEIGLPLAQKKRNSWNFSKKQRSRSESPHYIPLAETYTSSVPFRLDTQMKFPQQSYVSNATNSHIQIPASNYQQQPFSKKNVIRSRSSEAVQRCPFVPPERLKQNYFQNDVGHTSEQYRYISRTKKQAIVTRMYSQKRMLVNKLCKYKSKDCDEGFSSMADDECSFNCSCSSCSTRLSRKYGKYQANADDRFFFIRTDDFESKEERHLETVLESPIRINKSSDVVQSEKDTETNHGASWYECNDSLCKTPVKNNTAQPQALNKKIENIYENITQIINSATKQNYSSQEIKQMISTPISKSEKLKAKSNVPRALFHADEIKHKESITPIDREKKAITSPLKSPPFFSDSVILLQEIFQKLSLECRELLKPSVLSNLSADSGKHDVSESSTSSGDKYVNDLVKSLKSEEISEGEFANIIGNIAQNIFLEAKAKQVKPLLEKSLSLPDIAKMEHSSPKPIQQVSSLTENSFLEKCTNDQKPVSKSNSYRLTIKSSNVSQNGASESENMALQERNLPDGWSRSPTTISGPFSASDASNDSSHDDSTTSESGLQLLENAIRLGMGLSPIKTEETSFVKAVQEQPIYIPSPVKVVKHKSKDVLSCKGKLKLKIYHNAGMVTIHIARAAKLSKQNSRSLLNPYVKISMVPDESKRVNWRTSVQKEQKNPVFNQLFSFEILESDIAKRLVFSVWHRDFEKKRSELVGCMSFSVQHFLDNSHKIHGWYRLLREGFGTEKHFAAHTNKNACPIKHKEKKRNKECQDA